MITASIAMAKRPTESRPRDLLLPETMLIPLAIDQTIYQGSAHNIAKSMGASGPKWPAAKKMNEKIGIQGSNKKPKTKNVCGILMLILNNGDSAKQYRMAKAAIPPMQ